MATFCEFRLNILTRNFILVCLILLFLCYGVRCQTLTCFSVRSTTTNVFSEYNFTVSGLQSHEYTVTYDPTNYAPGNVIPLGTNKVTVSIGNATSSNAVIADCTFNVTVDIQELPITCPPTTTPTVGTDPGLPTFTYQPQPISIEYLPESATYRNYGPITETITYDGSSMDPALSVGTHSVRVAVSDGVLEKDCAIGTVIVEDREPPIIVCPDDINLVNTIILPRFAARNASDNVDAFAQLDFSTEPFIGANLSLGTTVVVFTALDRANNKGNCTFNVTVEIVVTTQPQINASTMQTIATTKDTIVTTNEVTTKETVLTTESETSPSAGTVTPVTTPMSTSTLITTTFKDDTISTTNRPEPDISVTTSMSTSTQIPTTFKDDTTSTTNRPEPDTSGPDTTGPTNTGGTASGPTTGPTPRPQTGPSTTTIIIACVVAGVVLLLIIVILGVICSNPRRRSIFGIGPKEPYKRRVVGASRHGVATDPVLLNDRLARKSNIYESRDPTEIENGEPQEMTENTESIYNPVGAFASETDGKSAL